MQDDDVCASVYVWLPTVTVPFRGAPVLASTVSDTLPFPVPAPDVTVIQGAIFVICVLTFRRGIVGEIAHFFKRSL